MAIFTEQVNYSKNFNFNPSGADVIAQAFSRIRIRRTSLEATHLQDAISELNLLQSSFSNMGPNLWTVDLQSIPLIQGVATYAIPTETIMILDAYVRLGANTTSLSDRILYPLSRSEYAALPNKDQQGPPSQFWFDRTISPTITFYLVPDAAGPYTVFYYRFRQMMDAPSNGGIQPEFPIRWLDAVVAELAYRLSRIYAPDLEVLRKADAEKSWNIAAAQDTENVPMVIQVGMAGYYR